MRDGAQMHPKTWVTRPPEPRGKDELLNTKVLTLLRSIPQFPKLKKKKKKRDEDAPGGSLEKNK